MLFFLNLYFFSLKKRLQSCVKSALLGVSAPLRVKGRGKRAAAKIDSDVFSGDKPHSFSIVVANTDGVDFASTAAALVPNSRAWAQLDIFQGWLGQAQLRLICS
jgi:hypothetical protein